MPTAFHYDHIIYWVVNVMHDISQCMFYSRFQMLIWLSQCQYISYNISYGICHLLPAPIHLVASPCASSSWHLLVPIYLMASSCKYKNHPLWPHSGNIYRGIAQCQYMLWHLSMPIYLMASPSSVCDGMHQCQYILWHPPVQGFHGISQCHYILWHDPVPVYVVVSVGANISHGTSVPKTIYYLVISL